MDDRSERLELVATVLLGIATAASAWCTYQGQLWDSQQLQDMATASKLQSESLRATDVTTRNSVVDATTFAYVLEAEARGDHRLSRYLTEVARPQFRPLLEDWLEKRSTSGARASTPFDDASYKAAAQKPSLDLAARAQAAFDAASIANENSDLFVMRTVTIALSLFFLGIAGQLRTRGARRLAVAFGALVLVASLLSLTRLERAGRPQRRPTEKALQPALGEASEH
jgi:hypothetical protein